MKYDFTKYHDDEVFTLFLLSKFINRPRLNHPAGRFWPARRMFAAPALNSGNTNNDCDTADVQYHSPSRFAECTTITI